jgi:putative ABC transport system permease protein
VIALRVFLSRLRSLLRPTSLDDRLQEELDGHIEMATADYIARGLPPGDARQRAMRDFGGVLHAVERHREARGFRALDALAQDVRHAIRSCRKTPVFAAVAVASLTLAIGANTAIFSLLYALTLRDLPVRDPGSLVVLTTVSSDSTEGRFTFPLFRELQRQPDVFSAVIGVWGNAVVNVEADGRPTRAPIWAATANIYGELGIRPVAGRLLERGDMTLDPPTAAQVVVISEGFWRRYFHADPSAIGQTVRVEETPFTVVGVVPAGFTGIGLVTEPDITLPLTATPLVFGRSVAAQATSASPSVRIIGRLEPGVPLARARARLGVLWPAIRSASVPLGYTGDRRAEFLSQGLSVASAAKGIEFALRSRFSRPLIILMSIAALMLLIACVNLAGLMVARAASRSHEVAVRLALGAGSWRIARHTLIEGVLLSMAGAAGGMVLAFWTCHALTAVVFEEFTMGVAFDGAPDSTVLTISTVTSIVVGLLFSVVPAWRSARQPSNDALQKCTRTVTRSGAAGKWMVATQVALSLVLVTVSGLLVRSLVEVRGVASGIDRTDDVLVAYPNPDHPGAYKGINDDRYYPDLIDRVGRLPGVERVSASLLKPGDHGGGFIEFASPIGAASDEGRGVEATRSPVAPAFFDTIGIPLLAGRDFSWNDNSKGPRVTILSHSLAARLFGDRSPLGQRLRLGTDTDRQDLDVIGVVADARLYDVKSNNVYAAYTPALQDPFVDGKCLVVRGRNVSAQAISEAVRSLGRESVQNMVTLRHITDHDLLQDRLTAMFSGFFAALALLLAAIGVYGLLSYTVAQQQREIGIRMALGADARLVVAHIVRHGLAVTAAGVLVGFLAALAAVQSVKALLFGVAPYDPITLFAAPAALVLVALVACALPAARAARVDPMIALRAE